MADFPPPEGGETGWYQDPNGGKGKLRYFDGNDWTKQTSRGSPPPPGAPSARRSKLGLPATDPVGEILAQVKGTSGTLVIGEHAIKIQRGPLGKLSGGHGDKVIPYRSISAVELKKPGVKTGHIHFTIAGGAKRAKNPVKDANTVTFNRRAAKFEEARDFIQGKAAQS